MKFRQHGSASMFTGCIDEYREGGIHGWLCKQGSDDIQTSHASIDGERTGDLHEAGIYRPDLEAAGIGSGNHGFFIPVPAALCDGAEHLVELSSPSGQVLLSRSLTFQDLPRMAIDACSPSQISGWVQSNIGMDSDLALVSKAGVVTRFTNHLPRKDACAYTGVIGDHGFRVRIPLAQRSQLEGDLWIEVADHAGFRFPAGMLRRRKLSVAFVCNAENPSDGSRHYRSKLAAEQLEQCGIRTQLFNERQIVAGATDPLVPQEWDVVVMQRVPLKDASSRLVDALRACGQRILYDVDDLLFKKWRIEELGAYRSGVADGKEAEYAASMEARLRLLMLCDGVICSTAYLQRELAGLGMPTLLSRNTIEDGFFVHGSKRLAGNAAATAQEPLRLLFMSGSATHRSDFRIIEPVLLDLLASRTDLHLTLLGDVGPSRLDKLANVERIRRMERTEMIRHVASHDVVLVPLERTGFNIAKSSLKFIEAAAAGVPVIASPMFEFKRDVIACKGGRIASSPAQWRRAIVDYAQDRALSRIHGERALGYCWENYRQSARQDHLANQILALDTYLLERERQARQTTRELRNTLLRDFAIST